MRMTTAKTREMPPHAQKLRKRFLTMPETAMSEPVLAFLSDRTEDPSISARLLLLTDSMPCGRNGCQVATASRRHT